MRSVERALINLGYAFIGDDLELVEKVNIEILDGVVTHIGRGWAPRAIEMRWGVALPSLTNSHIHLLDYAFPEYGMNLGITELVAYPSGLKYRMLSSTSSDKLLESSKRLVKRLVRYGVGRAIAYLESASLAPQLKREAGAMGLDLLLLVHPSNDIGKDLMLADGLGLDTPLRLSVDELKAIRLESSRLGRIVATHIAETREDREKGDFELAMGYLNPDLLIHGVHLGEEDILKLVEKGVPLVLCPRSNMHLGVGLPRVSDLIKSGVRILVGTDNAGIIEPDIWRELETLYNIGRLVDKNLDPKQILKAATVNVSGLTPTPPVIQEGFKADLIVLKESYVLTSTTLNPYASIVKRGSGLSVACVIRGGSMLQFVDKLGAS